MVATGTGRLGARYEGRLQRLDAAEAQAYARATNERDPAFEAATLVPPVFGVVPAWPQFTEAVTDLVPPQARGGLLHAGHDMRFLRPLKPGQAFSSAAELVAVRTGRAGSLLTVRLTTGDEGGELMLDQFATLFVRGFDPGPSGGAAPGAHPFPASARSSPVAEVAEKIDDDQAERYRDASGDTNPIHVDAEAARAAGLPGVILHGLCTLAFCSRAIVQSTAGGEVGRLARLAVRFSEPVFPGHDLVTSVYRAGSGDGVDLYAFEAASEGRRVVKDGLAEVLK